MSATRCPVARVQQPPYQWKITDYHDWTDGTEHCRFCGASRRDANSAPPGPPYRPLLATVVAMRALLREDRLAARRAKAKALAGKRAGHWLKNAANERERHAREKALRNNHGR